MLPTQPNNLIKRQALETIDCSSDSSSSDSSFAETTTPPPLPDKDTPVAQSGADELEQTPLPPKRTMSEPEGLSSRSLPEKSVLERYKRRIPLRSSSFTNASAAERATSTNTAVAVDSDEPEHQPRALRSRRRTPPDPTPIIRIPSTRPTVKVAGQDFVMLTDSPAGRPSPGISEGVFPRLARSIGLQPQPGRSTRSQTLRGKKFAAAAADEATDAGEAHDAGASHKLQREDSHDAAMQEEGSEIDSFPVTFSHSSSSSSESIELYQKQPVPTKPQAPAKKQSLQTKLYDVLQSRSRSPSSSPDALTMAPLNRGARRPPLESHSSQDSIKSIESIQIIPPIYDPRKHTDQQWANRGRRNSTSRPEHHWGWSKRWMCCHCGAETIFEQKTCARLKCAHEKCEEKCGWRTRSGRLRRGGFSPLA